MSNAKKSTKRSLNTETLRTLDDSQLAGVAGGVVDDQLPAGPDYWVVQQPKFGRPTQR